MTTPKKTKSETTAATKKTPAKAIAIPKKKAVAPAVTGIEDLKEELMVARITELEEDNLHLKDVNRELRDENAKKTRESGILRIMADELAKNPITSSLKPYTKTSKRGEGKIEESAVLLLSDLHGDQIIKASRVSNVEEYNFDVFCKRMERLVDVTIDHLTENMKSYSFKTLYVFSLGDLVSGEIHGSTEHTKWRNAIKNAVGVGEVIGMALSDLSANFDKVIVCSVSGNHGRRSIRKNFRGAHDNWDYLVNIQAQNKCRQHIEDGKIEFVTPDAWSMMVDVEGHTFHLSHGDDIKSFNGIPFYGMERKSRRLISIGAVTGKIPEYLCIGHYHVQMSMQTTNGEHLMSGSFPAADEFSYEQLGAYSEPFQLLFGVHCRMGKTWSLPIRLRTDNWREDEKKPSRYKVTIV